MKSHEQILILGGGIGFVYPASQHQLIAETHLVLLLYGMMTAGMIILTKDLVTFNFVN